MASNIKKSKSSGKKLGKYKAKEAKALSGYQGENRNVTKNRFKVIKLVLEKMLKIGELVVIPKPKPA